MKKTNYRFSKIIILPFFAFTLASFTQVNAQSAPLQFQTVWQHILKDSPEIAEQTHLQLASQLSLDRAKLHWAPSLGLQASAYSSNDPGTNFFGLLSQRSVAAPDFSPSTLNSPGYQTFQSVGLHLDMPLYEGGRRTETARAISAQTEAESIQLKFKKISAFAQTLEHYGNWVADLTTQKRLIELKDQVSKILSRYSIGSQSNPVGYSGILGLKGLQNRIDAELISIQTGQKTHQIALAVKSNLNLNDLLPSESSVQSLITKNAATISTGPSLTEELALKREESFQSAKNAEKSKFLPKIGLFGNESMLHGKRDTGYAFTGGVYLSWSLFNPDHYNHFLEKSEIAKAATQQRYSAEQTAKISRDTLNEHESSIHKTIQILSNSDQLLAEQVKVASRLFQSGSISALQLSEVYNRRADLILNLRQTEKQWIEIHTQKIILQSSTTSTL
jgi:outer membrane protein TolC